MSTKIKSLLKQVMDAAGEVVGEINALDNRIQALNQQRQSIGDAPVSKADFLEYISRSIDRQTDRFSGSIKRELEKVNRAFFSIERDPMRLLLLTGAINLPVVITEEACLWYLKPAIMARMEELTESIDFSGAGDAIPVEKRRVMVAQIDAEIDTLRAERADLANQLQAAGITD